MSDNAKPGADGAADSTPPPQDDIKNLKAEFGRKLDNTQAQLAAVLEQLKKSTTPAPQAKAEPQKKVSVFDDEDAYAARIKAETAEEIKAELRTQQAQQQKMQQVVSSIYSEYPEAQDEQSDLMKRAKEIYAGISDDEKTSPLAMKTAVAEAASELGVKPKSKRSADDSYSMGSSSSWRPSRTSREPEISQATLDFARAIGKDVDDPKYIASLKKAAARKSWKRYE